MFIFCSARISTLALSTLLLGMSLANFACDGSVNPEPEPLADRCVSTTGWQAGTNAFVDATDAWGLNALDVQGTRINMVDVNNDGLPDLFVRRGAGGVFEDFSGETSRRTYLLLNTGDGFVDVTEESGILTTRSDYGDGKGRPMEVAAFADIDNDGNLDVYTGVTTIDPNVVLAESSEILFGDGEGNFRLGPVGSDLRRDGLGDVPAGASFVDVDRDGFVDLFVPQHNYNDPTTNQLRFSQDRLFSGQADGSFVDVTFERGLGTADWDDVTALNEGRAHTRAWSSLACDLNNDGYAELLAASYGRAPNHLWQAESNGVFQNRSTASGYAFDDDTDWKTNQFALCFCQSSPQADGCENAPSPLISCSSTNWSHNQDRLPFRLGGNSGATVCGDVDNDGDMDLLTTEIKHWWAGSSADGSGLLLNDGSDDVTFTRPGNDALGIAIPHVGNSWDEGHMSGAMLDFDNDGWTDLYIGASDYPGNYGLLFHQDAPLEFSAVDVSEGIDHNRSHGVAVGDLDKDGDLDVVVGHSRSRCDAAAPNNCYETMQVRVFENVTGNQQNFVQLKLEGVQANRAAIGARVEVTTGNVTQTQEVGGGYGHYGAQNDLLLHFGIGTSCEADVLVFWPDGSRTEQRYTLQAGYRYWLEQGEEAQPIDG